ncbi:serine/threonine protein kinase [Paenibacillus yonginensis]|uniref:Serine/threonine protein kinase n=1 Tax=Paenibacillus yonginensis TaxID=1462996 RepID=A0A1B1N0M2_9BACL|nr:stage VI sporulation protein F [Paenibacillus yonginensis]ANS74984.1 serine/threonine protein kinase [Paenibacillus yonginensis]
MGYQQFGISQQLVQRVKLKMKNPVVKDRIKKLVENVNKADLQDPAKVRRLVKSASVILNERLTSVQEEQMTQFVLAQRIDPKNTFHLIKLWGMFR